MSECVCQRFTDKYLFHQLPHGGAQFRNQVPILVEETPVPRVVGGHSVQFHLQSLLQLEGLEAHQQTHSDGAQGHEHAHGHGDPGRPPVDAGFRCALARRRLAVVGRGAQRIHAEILLRTWKSMLERRLRSDTP